jgi:RND family efflux transporter MFP subunit
MADKKRIRHYLFALLILVALVAGGAMLHKKRAAEVAHIPEEPITPWALHVARVSDKPADSGFPALAMVSTREEVTIMARISGRILEMGPREGVRVKAGDLLVHIDTREVEDTINSLKAQYVAAQADAKRTSDEMVREKKLFRDGGSNESAVETRDTAFVTAKQKVMSIEHEINSLRVRKGYGRINVTADGIVAKRLAEPGDMAVPGRPLYKITESTGALARVELPQSILNEVHPGTPMVLYHNGEQINVPINRIFPTVDARALGIAEADLDKIPFDLPSGGRVACRIILKQVSDSIQVPYGSLLCGGDQQQCRLFKVLRQNNKDILKMVPVTVKLRGHDGIAVDGGLTADDRVIVAHESVLLQLKDGDPVTIAQGELP